MICIPLSRSLLACVERGGGREGERERAREAETQRGREAERQRERDSIRNEDLLEPEEAPHALREFERTPAMPEPIQTPVTLHLLGAGCTGRVLQRHALIERRRRRRRRRKVYSKLTQ